MLFVPEAGSARCALGGSTRIRDMGAPEVQAQRRRASDELVEQLAASTAHDGRLPWSGGPGSALRVHRQQRDLVRRATRAGGGPHWLPGFAPCDWVTCWLWSARIR